MPPLIPSRGGLAKADQAGGRRPDLLCGTINLPSIGYGPVQTGLSRVYVTGIWSEGGLDVWGEGGKVVSEGS